MKGGRIYRGQTERVVILLTSDELIELKKISKKQNKKISAIGRELIAQYNKEHRLERIEYLERKAREESQ